jgi:hypothetical protein
VSERQAQLPQAEENLQRLKDKCPIGMERDYNKLDQIKSLVEGRPLSAMTKDP